MLDILLTLVSSYEASSPAKSSFPWLLLSALLVSSLYSFTLVHSLICQFNSLILSALVF